MVAATAASRRPSLVQSMALMMAVFFALLLQEGTAFFTPVMKGAPRTLHKQHRGQRAFAAISMSDVGFGAGTQKKGGVKVGVKEKEAVKVSPKEKEKFEVEWRVLLHNDEVHTFDYVSRKLSEVVPTLTRSKAWECTLAAHSHDFSTIAIVTKDTAEDYCMKLQKGGLTISVAPDSNFKKDGEEGGGGGGPQGGKK